MSRWIRYLLILLILVGVANAALTVGLYYKVQGSREQAAFDSCQGRNIERGIDRKALVRQLKNIRILPEPLFKQFQTTKEESIRNVRMDIHSLFIINCKEYAKGVVEK